MGWTGAAATVSTASAEPETLTLSRYITVKKCYKGASCFGPVAKNIEHANVSIALEPFHKGRAVGNHAWVRDTVADDGLQFKSEIHIIQFTKPGKYKYFVYAMLRTGKRNGKISRIYLKDLSELSQKIVSDEPIAIPGGTLEAQLVIGPKLPTDHD